MHPVQARGAIRCAERQHQELLALADRDQLARSLHQWPETASSATITLTSLAMRVAAILLLIAFLAVAGI